MTFATGHLKGPTLTLRLPRTARAPVSLDGSSGTRWVRYGAGEYMGVPVPEMVH